jgi:SMP-30/gluconolaconase/LRE-like protein
MVNSPGAAGAWDVDRTVVRLPDPAIEVLDDRFQALTVMQGVVERLWTGGRWLEGPVWFGDGRYLLFSDIPNDRMLCWSELTGEVSVYRAPSGNSNGNTRDRQGRLITCEHRTRRVTRTEPDGSVTGADGVVIAHLLPVESGPDPTAARRPGQPDYELLGHRPGNSFLPSRPTILATRKCDRAGRPAQQGSVAGRTGAATPYRPRVWSNAFCQRPSASAARIVSVRNRQNAVSPLR